MSKWAIFDGTGSYRIGNVNLKPGATLIHDQAIIDRLERKRVPWITLSDTREIAPVEADAPIQITPIPFDKFQGRDDKWYYHYPVGSGEQVEQSTPFETEAEVDAAIIDARRQKEIPKVPLASELASPVAPLSGMLTNEDKTQTDWPCRGEGCDHKPFKSENGRTNHERIKHPELFGGAPRPTVAAPVPPPAAPIAPAREPDPDSDGVPNPAPAEPETPVVPTLPGEVQNPAPLVPGATAPEVPVLETV